MGVTRFFFAIRTFCSPKMQVFQSSGGKTRPSLRNEFHLPPFETGSDHNGDGGTPEFFNKNNLLSRCLRSQIYQSDSLPALPPLGTPSAEFVIFHSSHWRDIEIITPNAWPPLPSQHRLAAAVLGAAREGCGGGVGGRRELTTLFKS